MCIFSQSTPNCNMFGITESRLDSRISDQDINIPDYCISRKDSLVIGQTGVQYTYTTLLLTLHTDVKTLSVIVECIWLELKPSTSAPFIFVCILYRNPSASYEWFDNFVQMIDNIHTVGTLDSFNRFEGV